MFFVFVVNRNHFSSLCLPRVYYHNLLNMEPTSIPTRVANLSRRHWDVALTGTTDDALAAETEQLRAELAPIARQTFDESLKRTVDFFIRMREEREAQKKAGCCETCGRPF
jgi:hypothetical protein